jgi:predicted RecA/RadA family phage recombinase
MAINYVREGKTLTYSNTGSAIAAGSLIVIGHTLGVALVDIAATSGVGEVAIEGVFTLPKVTTAVITAGMMLLCDVSDSNKFDVATASPAAGDITYGATAMEAAGNGTTTVAVKLHPGGVKA